MTGSGDVPLEMSHPDPAPDVDRLLAGRSVDGAAELAALVAGLRGLAEAPVEARGDLALLLSEGVDPASRAGAADVPVWPPAAARGGRLRHPAVRVAGLSVAAKVLLGSGVAVASVGTAAGFGALPAPVQGGLASVVSTLTPFELPRAGAPDSEAPAPQDGTGMRPPAPAEGPVLPVPPADQPPVGPPVGPAPQAPAGPRAPAPAGDRPAPVADQPPVSERSGPRADERTTTPAPAPEGATRRGAAAADPPPEPGPARSAPDGSPEQPAAGAPEQEPAAQGPATAPGSIGRPTAVAAVLTRP